LNREVKQVLPIIIGLFVFMYWGQEPASNLIGRWIPVKPPPAGEAPTITASLTIEAKDKRITVAIQGSREVQTASVFQGAKDEVLLMIRTPAAKGATQIMIIRPEPSGQIRCEIFMEFPPGKAAANFYYAEVFKKGS
jgi:hypothetical protein